MFWKKHFGDKERDSFIKAVASMLSLQLDAVEMVGGTRTLEDGKQRVNRKAIGYIYGYTDSALQSIGQTMRDASVGVPQPYI